MSLPRRSFVRRLVSAGGGALMTPALAGLAACNGGTTPLTPPEEGGEEGGMEGYGPLSTSPETPELEIPEDFRCVRLSIGRAPSAVRPGFSVPGTFDGMAAFPLPNGNVRLIRNHEVSDGPELAKPIGTPCYDSRCGGGTTSLEVRISGSGTDLSVQLIDEFPSLAGTRVNCAGGSTPWGTWLSCEENTEGVAEGYERPHGFVFEVPVDAEGPVDPVPLVDMGRFTHEAVAVDPLSGIVYLTEDKGFVPRDPTRPGAGLYRFLPNQTGVLAAGGRLQMLAIQDQPGYSTATGQTPGTILPATWVDIDDPNPASVDDDPSALYREGFDKGGARFSRLEGAFYGDQGVYVVSTNGGDAKAGQVFHYRPTSPQGGELTLVFESPSDQVLDRPDNIVVSPRGGLVMCEDGGDDQFVRGLDGSGRILDLIRSPQSAAEPQPGEFAGSCFSPDGRVLFFNRQGSEGPDGFFPSVTYALWGPWERGPL